MQLVEGCIAQEKSFGPRSRCCQCKTRAIRDNIGSVKRVGLQAHSKHTLDGNCSFRYIAAVKWSYRLATFSTVIFVFIHVYLQHAHVYQ